MIVCATLSVVSTAPQQIGPFTVQAELGRGGMGVVYKAMDSRLDRPVAIKALPEHFADDHDRLARFEREAKSLAALNHPNVAGIHGVEEDGGARFLVMEYVDGETLAERLDRGPVPVDEALEVCIQIAAGLEAAHEAGVIHRDLKPANVKINSEGDAKILDFGLARADEGATGNSSASEIATLTSPHSRNSPTVPGAILGTAPYMSPEQARGRKVDKRTDIWSFGVLLYECLTGASPFVGETATDSIGAILHKDVDLGRLPAETPRSARYVIERCLQRDKSLRLRDIGDARIELQGAGAHDESALEITKTKSAGIAWAITCAMTLAAIALGAVLLLRPAPEDEPLAFDLLTPDGLQIFKRAGFSFSPDGERLAYSAVDKDGVMGIYIRSLATGEVTRVENAGAGASPMWSPDGQSIAFTRSGREIWKVDLGGGNPEMVAILNFNYAGGHWLEDDTLVIANGRGPVVKVSAFGGELEPVIDLFPETGNDLVGSPDMMPDGEHMLFMNEDDEVERSGLYIGSISTGEAKRILAAETNGRFVEPNILVYGRAGSLYAQTFDPDTHEVSGDPIRIASDVWQVEYPNRTPFEISDDGEYLAYFDGAATAEDDRLVWVDRETGEETATNFTGEFWTPRISHDGTMLAIDRTRDLTTGDISVIDLARGNERILTQEFDNESSPTWSADDSKIIYYRGDKIYQINADGSEEPTVLLEGDGSFRPFDVSSDGKWLLYAQLDQGVTSTSILNLETGESSRWRHGPGEFRRGVFSPDGKWILYVANDPGEARLYLGAFDNPRLQIPVSPGFGFKPRWRADGKEILYRGEDGIYAVPVALGASGTPEVGDPTLILELDNVRDFAMTPDASRFLLIKLQNSGQSSSFRVIKDWQAALR